MKTSTALLLLSLAVCLHFLFKFWDWRDAQVEAGAVKYEACVKAEFDTTPSRYYADHGQYPSCK